MRALVLGADGVALHNHHPNPPQGEGDVLVRVLRAGICETDLQLIRGYMGFRGVLGHEFVGIAQDGPLAGRRVVGEINCSCGACVTCQSGLRTHCPERTVIGILGHDGAFADYVAVPARNLHRVPDSVSTDAAVFCEPLAAAFQIPAQVPIGRSDRVIVLGDGRLGNLCAQVLSRCTARLLVAGKHPRKLAQLKRLGLHACLATDLPADHAADIVVDCTGSSTGLPAALGLVRPRGTVVMKTTVAGEQNLALAPVVINEVTLVGSRCGPFHRALSALESNDVDVLSLISERFSLAAGVEALSHARTQPVLKVLLDVDAGD
jgi:threonine dehydrogenase-like Zn-dependent dehydrogenase